MCQPRGAVAGGMVLDLDNSSVMAVECEDRRYCFQITSPSGKTYVHLSHVDKHVYMRHWLCFCLTLFIRVRRLQVNDSTSWEQKGIRRSKCETAVSDCPHWFYIFIPKLSARTSICHRTIREDVVTHLCDFHIWFCAWTHPTGLSQLVSVKGFQTARVWATGRSNVDLCVSFSVDLHCEQHFQTDLPDWQPRGEARGFIQTRTAC